MQEFAFRGHNERESSANKDNHKEFAEVMARYDALLDELMELSTVLSGMSKSIQNDLIASIASSIKSLISFARAQVGFPLSSGVYLAKNTIPPDRHKQKLLT